MKAALLLILSLFLVTAGYAQYRTQAQQIILTNEDSLNAGGIGHKRTVVSGYGSALYQRDFTWERSRATLERAVLFIGHQFNSRIAFFSEMEIENALVAGMEEKGEIAMEQAFLKFNLNSRQYLVAGLFIPRIGILNENHLPVNFNGVERPIVETLVIPATWRELGVGFYGTLPNQPLNYSIALVNGLDSKGFVHGTGIVGGRAEGSNAMANNIAVTAALQYSFDNFKVQVSGYTGGTTGMNKRGADSLGLNSGAFGTPVYLGEADVQYNKDGWSARVLGTYISLPEANKVNRAYATNIANSMYGAYAELGYDLFHAFNVQKKGQLVAFGRYEMLDLNASIPSPEAIYDGTLKQSHLIAGLTYLPIPNVCVKADVRLQQTGNANPALIINPSPNALPYQTNITFLNIGVGYSF
ncbi:MAG: hypothetical protein EOP51_10425 [Sphingobacteriales bacterium]|nr:MAG: hypothetical protein EOP51_10425 [Sphingobacteriales bacterium]